MLDNGAPRTIESADGTAIAPLMVQERMFLPFRFFGEAVLGVNVSWNDATQTATFNAAE